MRIFKRDGKFNFVDDQNTFVGYDDGQSCCEWFGYFLSYEEPTKIIEPPDTSLELAAKDYNFDKSYFKKIRGDTEDGGIAIFKLTKPGANDMFLALFNSHNGYYGHGFTFTVDGTQVQEDYL